ncbi:NB-ARC domain-containing protein [Mycena venus]|uniref:NB-ARC domain-containing protein n=1 Tax=Mycena venus TaxID=2733690 RepID=A0A8H7CXR1_9AGAR|nr:NB-ARC domain-containing protein [Mycena venus]
MAGPSPNEDTLGNSHSELLEYTTLAAQSLQQIAKTYCVPFLQPIFSLTMRILEGHETAKVNKNVYYRIVQLLHMVECVIGAMCVTYKCNLPIGGLENIGRFASILQKIYGSVRSHQELGKIRRLFRRRELTTQLETCEIELQELRSFADIAVAVDLVESNVRERHQELLSLLQTNNLSQESVWDSMRTTVQGSSMSLLSLLPASPQIFHGRTQELKEVVDALMAAPARIAILGPGGIGKTTLARATLHSPDIVSKYAYRWFVSCDGVNTNYELVNTIGLHLGLDLSRQLTRQIVQYLSQCGPAILVLDNLETPWECNEYRDKVEEFLASLSDVGQLALLITMRGAQRPGKVKWTRPFLHPLKPLHPSASAEIFYDISDPPSMAELSDFEEIMSMTGHLPLAVSLMASVASSEGYSGTLMRWKAGDTSLVSIGNDRGSNLDRSIQISLSSPRMMSRPTALHLLSVLAVLPDGLSDAELAVGVVPIPSPLECKSILLSTSLAYIDRDGRIKALSPIRDYVQRVYPPKKALLDSLGTYWQDLLKLWDTHIQLSNKDLASQLTANIGNINNLILHVEKVEDSLDEPMLHSIIILTKFSQFILKSDSPLLPLVPKYADHLQATGLQWNYFMLRLSCSGPPVTLSEARLVIPETMEAMTSSGDVRNQALLCHSAASYYVRVGDLTLATEFNNRGMALISQAAFDGDRLRPLHHTSRAAIELEAGRFHSAISYALKGQAESRKIGTVLEELQCAVYEAQAFVYLGDLPTALQILQAARELAISSDLEGTDRDLGILDVTAEALLDKSQYVEAYRLYQCISQQTSPIRSPRYHIYSSLALIEIETLFAILLRSWYYLDPALPPVSSISGLKRPAEDVLDSESAAPIVDTNTGTGDDTATKHVAAPAPSHPFIILADEGWFDKLDEEHWALQPWYDGFRKFLHVLRGTFESILPTVYQHVQIIVVANPTRAGDILENNSDFIVDDVDSQLVESPNSAAMQEGQESILAMVSNAMNGEENRGSLHENDTDPQIRTLMENRRNH